MCHNTEKWCIIWVETDLCFEKWHEEFWLNTWNLDFDEILLSKVENVWA